MFDHGPVNGGAQDTFFQIRGSNQVAFVGKGLYQGPQNSDIQNPGMLRFDGPQNRFHLPHEDLIPQRGFRDGTPPYLMHPVRLLGYRRIE